MNHLYKVAKVVLGTGLAMGCATAPDTYTSREGVDPLVRKVVECAKDRTKMVGRAFLTGEVTSRLNSAQKLTVTLAYHDAEPQGIGPEDRVTLHRILTMEAGPYPLTPFDDRGLNGNITVGGTNFRNPELNATYAGFLNQLYNAKCGDRE
jgi:hypothetical protein